ncbi:MAG: omptin family outer membrane protease [Pseudomonadota bacterium]
MSEQKTSREKLSIDWVAYLIIIMLALQGVSAAETLETEPSGISVPRWSADLKLKNHFNSHTSYEFGNPFFPHQAPLSRLEFPLNTLWAGLEVRRNFSRVSIGIEVLRNLSSEAYGSFKDSDWDDEDKPEALSIYSESACRMEPSYDVRGDIDLKISDWIGLPRWLDLRPVTGFRWQRFSLVSHDGVQYYPASGDTTPPDALPGDGIRFEQTYRQYFLGIRSAFDLEKPAMLSRLKLLFQLDWAYVEGDNEDHHLLRSGDRVTYERSSGDAWHASCGLKAGLSQNVNAVLEADYLAIQTTGSHRLMNTIYGVDMTWDDGVKVWSEQKGLMLTLEYLF